MIAAVADTHTALWYLFDDPRLSAEGARLIEEAASVRKNIALSSISLAELVYLIEKQRLPELMYAELRRALADPNHVLTEVAVDSRVFEALRRVPRAEVPDLPDRIIAATAILYEAPVISRDRRIVASSVETIW